MPAILNEFEGWHIMDDDREEAHFRYYMGHSCYQQYCVYEYGNSYYCRECKVKMSDEAMEHFIRVWKFIR
jgi:hypothetical protein